MKSRIVASALALCFVALAFSGCQNRDGGSNSGAKPGQTVGQEQLHETDKVSSLPIDVRQNIEEAKEQNGDTVGWLYVPGTNIEDVVLQKTDDPTNEYYRRRDFNKNYEFNGVYYADFRAQIGGTRDDLGVNTCIYGHSIVDDVNDERYNIKFGNLHDFRNPELAKNMPYLVFSTPEDDMVFEVFAVFMGNSDNPAFNYNDNPPAADFLKTINELVLPRSLYDYGVELTENDKFLTLSTCLYLLPDGRELDYETTQFRYAVMARLVEDDQPLKTEVSFKINKDPILDPDGRWSEVGK